MPARPDTRVIAGAVIACLALGLVACAESSPPDTPTSTAPTHVVAPSVPSGSPEPSGTPTRTPPPEPTLQPEGGAADNLPYFEEVLDRYVGAYGRGERAILVEHLRNAGFRAGDIEAGWVTTPNGLQEVSIEAAVRFGEDCLVATVRADRWTAAVMPLLSTGNCLIGGGFDTGR